MATDPVRRDRWPTLLLQSSRASMILSPSKRIRAVNPAWEQLTGVGAAEAVGMACLRRGPTEQLFRTLAPPLESKTRITTVRKAVPGTAAGPPWWDVTFVPLPQIDSRPGFLVQIEPVATEMHQAERLIPEAMAAVRARHQKEWTIDLFGGSTPSAVQFTAKLEESARSSAPVWLIGEPGSGKETAARAIHEASPFKNRAFFALDGAGSPGFLSDSILFGRGSFGESGLLGTLFLKEPQTLPRDSQQQLLAWLDGPGRSVRVIVGSRKPAVEIVREGVLIPDFLARFAILELTVPPLRERLTDLSLILDRIIRRFGRTVTHDTADILKQYSWPGNLREFIDVLTTVDIEGPIRPEQLPRFLRESASLNHSPPAKADSGPKLDDVLIQVERRMLMVALTTNNGNVTKAADWLGIPRTRFMRRAESLGVVTAKSEAPS